MIIKATPFVSVLMTAYNREKYIGDAIQSVLASTYTNYEFIVVDDSSTDKTVSIIRSYEQKDSRIKLYINKENIGDYPNRNRAVSYASGKYIKFVDSDDMIYPYTLQEMVDAMEMYPAAAMGISQITNKLDEHYPEIIEPETVYKQHFYGEGIFKYGPIGTIINRDIFLKLGGFTPKRYIADSEFWLKLSAVYPILKLPPGLVFWRIHEEQEYYIGNASHSYIESAYKVFMDSFKSDKCPLKKEDIDRITRRLQWKHARDILSLAFKKKATSASMESF